MTQSSDVRQWAAIIHFSQLAGYLVPLAGFVVPIVIWQIKKEEMPELDIHGKIVTNWIISEFIYFTISGILVLLLIGFLFLIPLMIISVVFPIIGGIKASEGKVWKYPLSIGFV